MGSTWQSQAIGTLFGLFIPERHLLVLDDGEQFPATASPNLLRWFAEHPSEAAQPRLWTVYPRSDRQSGLAFYVIGTPSAASAAEANRHRADADRFLIQGSVANQTTDRSKKRASVFIRIGRNIPRPPGRRAGSANWKTRLLRLSGGLGPSAAVRGKVVALTCVRRGRELRIVGVRRSTAPQSDPITWYWPRMQWPWPFDGKVSTIAEWTRSWWGGGRQQSIDSLQSDAYLRSLPEPLLSTRPLRPPFLLPNDWPAREKATLERLDRFVTIQHLLATKTYPKHRARLVQAIQKSLDGQTQADPAELKRMQRSALERERSLQLEADRVRIVAGRLKRTLNRQSIEGRAELHESTGLLHMLSEQLEAWEKAAFQIALTPTGPSVTWFTKLHHSPDHYESVRLPVTGNLKRLLLQAQPLPEPEQQAAPVKGSECQNEAAEDPLQQLASELGFTVTDTTLAISRDIRRGTPDTMLLRRHKIAPGQLTDVCRMLAEVGWPDACGLGTADVRSTELRRAMRRLEREQKGLSPRGLERKTPDPI